MSNTLFERTITVPLDLPQNKNTYIIGVPKYHEKLYQIIKDNHEWLSENGSSRRTNKDIVFLKKINSQEEFDKLESLIKELRSVGSELFIDPEFHPKPSDQKTSDYIAEFIKNKSINTHYICKTYYRVTVFPFGFDYTQHVPLIEEDSGRRQKLMEIFDLRQEYLIAPLYIILKRGKTFEQMKMISYNPDGGYTVEKVNPNHFWRIEEATE